MMTPPTSPLIGNINPPFQLEDRPVAVDLSRAVPSLSRPIHRSTVISGDLERCHSSTQMGSSDYVIVAFKGKKTDSAAPGIWMTFSGNGLVWSKPQQIVEAKDASDICWSPVFCQWDRGPALLFYRQGPSPDKLTTHVLRTEQGLVYENGDYFLDKQVKMIGPTKTKGLLTDDDLLILGSSSEKGAWTFDGDNQGSTGCHIERFDNKHGQWLTRSANLQMPEGYDQERGGAIEPTLFKYGIDGNKIGLLCRNRNRGVPSKDHKGGWALFSVSEDNGKNWSQLQESTLRNPDTSLDIVDLGKGQLIVFYNDSHDTRHRLSFALSSNGGETWSAPCLLNQDEGEFPSAILLRGLISVTYADKKGQLNHMYIDPGTIEVDGKTWLKRD